MRKSSTDIHWNKRATAVQRHSEVNIVDVFQRDVELDCIAPYLDKSMKVLEVGCGNGWSTSRFRDLVAHVDAFDYSEEMIASAKKAYGEKNNTFFVDNVLDPKHLNGSYDAVLCVRVLINLRNLDEQKVAIENIASFVKQGARLILVEGFTEGFDYLNALRARVSLPKIEPAKINFYSSIADVMPTIDKHFDTESDFHLGSYDFLTRVVYPLVAGHNRVEHNTVFSERSAQLAMAHNPDCYAELSRVKGLILRKK